jgi:hypothetical protein
MAVRQPYTPVFWGGKLDKGGSACHKPHPYCPNLRLYKTNHVKNGISRVRVPPWRINKDTDRTVSGVFQQQKLPDCFFGKLLVYCAGKQNRPGFEHFSGKRIQNYLPAIFFVVFFFIAGPKTDPDFFIRIHFPSGLTIDKIERLYKYKKRLETSENKDINTA